MIKLNQSLFFFLIFVSIQSTSAQNTFQSLDLNEAYEILEIRYPIFKNDQVNSEILKLQLDKIDKNKLPSLYFKTDGRIQSENVQLDIPESAPFPLDIDLPLYSIRSYAEGQYLILDGGLAEAQKKILAVQNQVELQKSDIDRFALRERVNRIYTNLLVLDANLELLEIAIKDLSDRRKQIENAISEGIANKYELTRLDLKVKEINGNFDVLNINRSSLIASLEDLLGIKCEDGFIAKMPILPDPMNIPAINRPEKEQFKLQKQAILANSMLIDAQKKPKLSAFAQAGIGYPNPLNILSAEIAPYALIGINFQWRITDWKKDKIERSILSLQTTKLTNAEETFDFNLRSKEASYVHNIQKINAQINNKKSIIELQESLLTDLDIRVKEGVISSSEYLNEFNQKLKMEQEVVLLEAELINTQLKFFNERGAF